MAAISCIKSFPWNIDYMGRKKLKEALTKTGSVKSDESRIDPDQACAVLKSSDKTNQWNYLIVRWLMYAAS